ncbi:anti-phage-associated DUF3780 domain-containing protein [Vibrio alginolyticus]|uniref:anti-phage-associated DUF3780 domain-containing protein n=1 Tax=Vibrio alginolyticus TaxID=663 RepID=UPI00215E02AF|nr:anti-phage-associated DUF3780 domain-containing protein [Vibrio alginolyticus]MCS0218241.1 DUF3780 and DUF4357 domain-containing protein [Vibrio alginolyticus]
MSKVTAKQNAPKYSTLGFGVPASSDPHHFKVIIPKANSGKVEISEHLGMQAQSEELSVIDRVVLDRPSWSAIRAEVQRAFNARLKSYDLKPSSWKVGENVVDRLLGKELCVLAWAIEGMDVENISVAVRNWLALRPEERWWLFGMTAMSTGHKDDRDVGWRIALRHALGDIVQTESLEKDRQVREVSPGYSLVQGESEENLKPSNESSQKPAESLAELPASNANPVGQDEEMPLPVTEPKEESSLAEDVLFLFEAKKAKAGGHPVGDMSKPEFVVGKGSTANIAVAKSLRPAIRELRKKLLDEGVLVEDGEVYSFTCEYTFKSPSLAACVIAGNPRSGMDAWRDLKGRSLKELGYGKKTN